jgi:hypothetical protein
VRSGAGRDLGRTRLDRGFPFRQGDLFHKIHEFFEKKEADDSAVK